MKSLTRHKSYIIVMAILSLGILSGCGLGNRGPAADGGFFVSYNSAETWEAKNLISQSEAGTVTISTLDSADIVFDPQDPLIMYFISRSNGIYKTIDGGEIWSPTTLSAGSYSALTIDPNNSDIIYAAQGVTVLKSVDGMDTWATIYVETRTRQTITSLIVDSFDPSIIYASTQNFVIKSEDFGTTWRSLDWIGNFATKMYMSKKDTRTIYLYSLNYGFFKTTDGGKTWSDLSAGLVGYIGSNRINWIDFHPQTERLTIATYYGILTSTDGGETWIPIETLIPYGSLPIQAVVISTSNSNEIFFTVSNVLHKTVDGGKTWKTIKTIPTTRTVSSLYMSRSEPSTLFAGTLLTP